MMTLTALAVASCKSAPEGPYITIETDCGWEMGLYLTGNGEAVIDWGDWSRKDTVKLSPLEANPYAGLLLIPDGNKPVSHTYKFSRKRTITITGDITGLESDRRKETAWLFSGGVSGIAGLDSEMAPSGRITALDVSHMPGLIFLGCENEWLKSLDVSKNRKLEILRCSINPLPALDVSGNTALKSLGCAHTLISTLDVGGNAEQEHLYCPHNRLEELDVSRNKVLDVLSCGHNRLRTLDLSENSALRVLQCDFNDLTALDVGNNPMLKSLECRYNNLFTLDVSGNAALEDLFCDGNDLTSLVMSENPLLENLEIHDNRMGREALLSVFNNLPMRSSPHNVGVMTSGGNPGWKELSDKDKAIPKQKAWTLHEYILLE